MKLKKFALAILLGTLAIGPLFSYFSVILFFGLGFSSSMELLHPSFTLSVGAILGLICAVIWTCFGNKEGKSSIIGALLVGAIFFMMYLSIEGFTDPTWRTWRIILGYVIIRAWSAFFCVWAIDYIMPVLIQGTTKSKGPEQNVSKRSQVYSLD